ncbi:ATP-dependent helicase [Arsenicicoccus bolidensis]|uniref:ATP-dependent helicase n=1 Tax=Arsenicicoccus bolidensis TaxID=229480 RepID=UPI0028AE9B42|nr:ATP-dependent DNA helicase [Arsenicicoccus bolidensis]
MVQLRRTPTPLLAEAPVLDERQRAVLASTASLLQVVGAPGSGKSTLAVELVVDRVRRGLVEADRALLLTSSRVAAAGLRDRITSRLGGTTTTPLARTHQSLGFGVLRSEAALVGDPSPRLLSGAEQDAILKELLDGHALGVVRGPEWPESVREALGTRGFRAELRDLLMRAVERGLVPEDLVVLADRHGRPEWRAAAAVLEEYDQVTAFSRPGAYDPAWVLSAAADRLEESAEALDRVRSRIGLIVVDDAQELTWSAARLLSVVRAPSTPLVLVGDPDTAVQTFRGADPRVFASDWERWFGGDDLLSLGETHVLGCSHRQGRVLAAVTARVSRQVGAVGVTAHRQAGTEAPVGEAGHPVVGPGAGHDAGVADREVEDHAAATTHQTDPGAAQAGSEGTVETVLLRSAAQEAAHVSGVLRRAHLVDGVPWSQMAVVCRGRSRLAALRQSLAAAGVPVPTAMTDLPVREEPAARALLTLLEVVVRVARGQERPLEPDVAVDLLLSPLGGSDPVAVRRLRRALRRREQAAGGHRAPDQLLVAALLRPSDPSDPSALDDDALPTVDTQPVRRLGRAIARAAGAARLTPEGRWSAETTAESILWQLWSALGVADDWRGAALSSGPMSVRFDRHLDAVVALFGAAGAFAERLPGAGPEAFLEQVLGQEVAADSLVAQAPTTDVVQVLTPQGAAGGEWDLVVVAGVQEGVWPDLRLRGSLLGSEHLVDLLAGRGHGPREALAAVRSDEARLLLTAVSRARRRLVVTAVSSEDEQPSSYLDVIDPPEGDGRSVLEVPRPMTLTGVVAELRRRVLSDDAAHREQAAARLGALADVGVPGADPGSWWALRRETDARPLYPDDLPVPVSPSRIESFGRCRLMWVLRSHGGEGGDRGAADLGTLVHEIAADPDVDLTDATTLRRELDRRWPELGLPDSWRGRHDHDRAGRMVDKLADYARTIRDEGWELVAVEQEARVEIGRALLTGRVDRLERAPDGRLRVVDIKTGRSAPTQAELADHAQLAAYQAAVEAGAFPSGTGSAGAALLQLGGDRRAPRVQPQAPAVEADDPGWARELVESTAEGMAGDSFPATPGDHCSYCPVRRSCPAQPEGRTL